MLVNPTRTGFVEILQAMGGHLASTPPPDGMIEPTAEIRVKAATLAGTQIGGERVVRAIDEFPILAVAATQAAGLTTVRDAAELRVKESDRIASVSEELEKMGARLEAAADGFTVRGPVALRGAQVDSHMDHRLAMALAIAGLVAQGDTRISRAEVIDDSFPDFVPLLQQLGAEMEWL